mgnify:FL=1
MLLWLMLTIGLTITPIYGFSPLAVKVTVSLEKEAGAFCLTIDGPEFHRSCWGRLPSDRATREMTYTLTAPGHYRVWLEDKTGKSLSQVTVRVLGSDEETTAP